MSDFWDEMNEAYSKTSVLDDFLNSRQCGESRHCSVLALTDRMRAAHALPLPVDAGARVRFVANLGSVLTYDSIPNPKVEGTVVTVKTAGGHATSMDDRVFVLWDDGQFRPILAEHLRRSGITSKKSHSVRIVASSMMDLSAFFGPTASQDELVHKATKDLWSFHQEGGNFIVERLFDDTGNPLKD